MAIIVIKNRCPQNHPCPSIKVCPAGALRQNGFKAPVVDESKCTNCGKCAKFCPMGALTLKQ
jgi:ferredoxin